MAQRFVVLGRHQEPAHRENGDNQNEQSGQDTSRTPRPKLDETEAPGLTLVPNDRRDQIPGDYKKYVNTDEPAGQARYPEVKQNNSNDRDGTQAINVPAIYKRAHQRLNPKIIIFIDRYQPETFLFKSKKMTSRRTPFFKTLKRIIYVSSTRRIHRWSWSASVCRSGTRWLQLRPSGATACAGSTCVATRHRRSATLRGECRNG